MNKETKLYKIKIGDKYIKLLFRGSQLQKILDYYKIEYEVE